MKTMKNKNINPMDRPLNFSENIEKKLLKLKSEKYERVGIVWLCT